MAAKRIPRRTFGGVIGGTSLTLLNGAIRAGATAPSEQIRLGQIGLGARGFNLIDCFTRHADCRIVAVCDVDRAHYRDRPWGKGRPYGREGGIERLSKAYAAKKSGTSAKDIVAYADYRDLLARDDLDAIIVATPDHWHALITWDSLRSGRDVYCEKPVTHLFAEGRSIAGETARQQAVVQVGSQQRSDPLFHYAVRLAKDGTLGDIESIEVGLPPGYDKPQGSTEVVEPRPSHDYEFWCGPAPRLPLMRARHHRWWRGHRAFGGGVLMDWIGHHNDIAQWAIGQDRNGPVRVEAESWQFPDTDVYNTPQHYEILCEYHGGVTSSISDRHRPGLKIIGSDGWVYANRGRIEASNPAWIADVSRNRGLLPHTVQHVRNFLDCVRSRQECAAPPAIAHRSITPGYLGYVSHELQRPLVWDPVREQVVDDAEANRLLNEVRYRAPWQVPPAEPFPAAVESVKQS